MTDPRIEPTPERLAKAGKHWEKSNVPDKKEAVTRVTDDPLGKLLSRNVISAREEDAGKRFYAHWYLSHESPPQITSRHMSFVDRFDAPGLMFDSERAAHWGQRYREAVQVLGKRQAALLQALVCEERSTEDLAWTFLERTGPRAITAICGAVSIALKELVDHYGL